MTESHLNAPRLRASALEAGGLGWLRSAGVTSGKLLNLLRPPFLPLGNRDENCVKHYFLAQGRCSKLSQALLLFYRVRLHQDRWAVRGPRRASSSYLPSNLPHDPGLFWGALVVPSWREIKASAPGTARSSRKAEKASCWGQNAPRNPNFKTLPWGPEKLWASGWRGEEGPPGQGLSAELDAQSRAAYPGPSRQRKPLRDARFYFY